MNPKEKSETLFISIPKTGTNTVHALMRTCNFNHLKSKMILSIMGEEKFKEKASFCFIRKPNDLVKSWYFYHKFSPNVIRKEVKGFYPDSFEEWCFDMKFKTHWEDQTHKKHNPHWDLSSPLFQKDWVCDERGDVIVQNIYKFDNFNKVLKNLFNRPVPVKNKSEKNKYNITRECQEKMEDTWREDMIFYESIYNMIEYI